MTLHRWIVAGKVRAPDLRIRNGRAVRLWGKTTWPELLKVKQATYCEAGEKKGYKPSKAK